MSSYRFESKADRVVEEIGKRGASVASEKFSCQMMETYQIGAFCGIRLVESVAFRVEIC